MNATKKTEKKEPLGQIWLRQKTKQAVQIAAIKEGLSTVEFVEKIFNSNKLVKTILNQLK